MNQDGEEVPTRSILRRAPQDVMADRTGTSETRLSGYQPCCDDLNASDANGTKKADSEQGSTRNTIPNTTTKVKHNSQTEMSRSSMLEN